MIFACSGNCLSLTGYVDIPEYKALNQLFPETDWDRRTRGIGATTLIPVSSCAEENLLCFESDPYRGADILIHEFAHTIHTMGLRYLDTNFDKALQTIYRMAKREGLWENTYAMTNYIEYFAEGVQSLFNVNMEANPVGISIPIGHLTTLHWKK